MKSFLFGFRQEFLLQDKRNPCAFCTQKVRVKKQHKTCSFSTHTGSSKTTGALNESSEWQIRALWSSNPTCKGLSHTHKVMQSGWESASWFLWVSGALSVCYKKNYLGLIGLIWRKTTNVNSHLVCLEWSWQLPSQNVLQFKNPKKDCEILDAFWGRNLQTLCNVGLKDADATPIAVHQKSRQIVWHLRFFFPRTLFCRHAARRRRQEVFFPFSISALTHKN